MAIFSRNKDEEDFGPDEKLREKEDKSDRKLSKKFKDLNPKNKRKRKEPPKPWGKRERISVAAMLILTTLGAATLAFSAKGNKLPGIPRISLKFSGFDVGNPFGEKTFEIGQTGNYKSEDEKAKEAIEIFDKETKPFSGGFGFYVVRLTDGSSYGMGDNEKFQGTSLLSLPLMVLFYKNVDGGSINLDTKYVLKNSDKVKGSGSLADADAGTVYTYRELIGYMSKDSDQTAYKIVKNILGETMFRDFLIMEGLIETSVSTGITTPREIGTFLQALYQGQTVSDKSKQEIYSLLVNTTNENWITKGVPGGIKVIHKFSQDVDVMGDAGIVLAPKPYAIVIMSKEVARADVDKVFAALSNGIFRIESDVK